MNSFFALVAFAVVGTANGGTITSTWSPQTYVAAQTPTAVTIIATFATEVAATNKIVITASPTIFAVATSTSVTCSTTVAATTALTCLSVSGVLTCTIGTAAITANTSTTIVCSTNLAVNGAASSAVTGTIQHVNSSGGAVDASIAIGAVPAYQFTAATATGNSTNSSNSTNGTTTGSALLINSAATVSLGPVAFLLASLF